MTLFSWFNKKSIETIEQPLRKLQISRNKSMWPITKVGHNNDTITQINHNIDQNLLDSSVKPE